MDAILKALEKAYKKLESVDTFEKNRAYTAKLVKLKNQIKTEHSNILGFGWDNGIFY